MDSRKKIPWLRNDAFDPDLLYEVADEISPPPHFEEPDQPADTKPISRDYIANIDYDSFLDDMTIPG
ncbi:MAG: hypothetical protein N2491_02095 [Negativicutes bacterium]|nr:hypothetical protein [Negativicutes bacterium]